MVGDVLPGVRRVEHVMGMPIVIDVRDDAARDRVLDLAFGEFRAVDARFSTFRDDSEIMRINRGDLGVADAHPDVREILDRCEALRIETRGFFDVRAASRWTLEPSGLVKGWSVDRVSALLEAAGLRDFAISAGGDVVTRGRALPDDCWRVGIQHPELTDSVAGVVVGTDLAIATSGAYARGDHVLDPHTGRAPTGVLSVTITGPVLATADAYATAAFAMGMKGPAWTARLRDYEAMTILSDGRVLATPGFPWERARPDHALGTAPVA